MFSGLWCSRARSQEVSKAWVSVSTSRSREQGTWEVIQHVHDLPGATCVPCQVNAPPEMAGWHCFPVGTGTAIPKFFLSKFLWVSIITHTGGNGDSRQDSTDKRLQRINWGR